MTTARHTTFGPPAGNFSTRPVSRQTSSRFGPIHCGQSSPRAAAVNGTRANRSREVRAGRRMAFTGKRAWLTTHGHGRLAAVLRPDPAVLRVAGGRVAAVLVAD